MSMINLNLFNPELYIVHGRSNQSSLFAQSRGLHREKPKGNLSSLDSPRGLHREKPEGNLSSLDILHRSRSFSTRCFLFLVQLLQVLHLGFDSGGESSLLFLRGFAHHLLHVLNVGNRTLALLGETLGKGLEVLNGLFPISGSSKNIGSHVELTSGVDRSVGLSSGGTLFGSSDVHLIQLESGNLLVDASKEP